MENRKAIIAATALRLLLGWFMFYDGIIKVVNPAFTAKGFLLGAKTFPGLYAWFASPMNIWWIDPLNAWGITLIGVALILGVWVRPAAWAGALMMIIYYFPHYTLPFVPNGFIVEDHLIYAAVFVFIAYYTPALKFGFGEMLQKTFLGKIPYFGKLL